MAKKRKNKSDKSEDPPGYSISAADHRAGLIKVQEAIDGLKLDTTSPKVVIMGYKKDNAEKSRTRATDSAGASTIQGYESHWKQFLDFCIAMGDFETAMLYARDLCPLNPWASDPVIISHYIRMRTFPKGSELTHFSTLEPVYYADGTRVICQGAWQRVSTLEKFQAGLRKLHAHYETTRDTIFRDVCQDCRALGIEAAQNNKSCTQHAGRGSFYNRHGCVTFSDVFKGQLKAQCKHLEELDLVRATFALLPAQLRDIRLYCLASNDPYWLMVWTIIIVGVKAFLRISEALSIDIDRFQEEHFVCQRDSIKALAMWVLGKSEIKPVTLLIWDDVVCPEFSSMRAILVWIKYSGIKSGKLFPSKAALRQKLSHNTTALDYEAFRLSLRWLIVNVVKMNINTLDQKHIIGTHVLRKTAHLLAYWAIQDALRRAEPTHDIMNPLGSLHRADISNSARHKVKSRHVSTYLQDAGLLHQLCRQSYGYDHPEHLVGPFFNIRMETAHQFMYLNRASQEFRKPIVELASQFVHKFVGIAEEILSSLNTHELCNRATEYSATVNLSLDVASTLRACLPMADANRILTRIGEDQRLNIQAAINRMVASNRLANQIDQDPSAAVVAQAQDPSTAVVTPSQKRPRMSRLLHSSISIATATPAATLPPSEEDDTLKCSRNYQAELSKRGKDKPTKGQILDIACSAITEISELKKQEFVLRAPLKDWANKASKVVACLENCHHGNRESFLLDNPKFTLSTFTMCNKKVKHKTHIP